MSQAQQAAEVTQAGTLIDQVRHLQSESLRLMAAAEKAGDLASALRGIAEARRCVELLLECEGEIDRRAQVNILIAPAWLEIRSVIIGALQSHPEAAQAVAESLQSIESGYDS